MSTAPRILFLGFYAEPTYLDRAFRQERNPQVSAIKFQSSLLNGLAENGCAVSMLAGLPIAPYPHNPIVRIKESRFTVAGTAVSGVLMPCINLPGVRLVSRLLTAIYYGCRLQRQQRHEAIIAYSLHTPFLLAAWVLRAIYKLPLVLFILDLPYHMNNDKVSFIRRMMKHCDNYLLRTLASSADVVFPVTPGIGRDWLKAGVHQRIIECVAPQGIVPLPAKKPASPPRVVYTGTFSQMEKFMRFFCASPIQATMVFIGNGPDKQALLDISHGDPRVTITDFILGDALDAAMEDADFFLNPRDTAWAGGQYSFPSKLFDYMARGRPVITTPLLCIPAAYFDCYLKVLDTDQESFNQSFATALAISEDEKSARVACGLALLQKRSPAAVGAAIVEEIRSLQHARA